MKKLLLFITFLSLVFSICVTGVFAENKRNTVAENASGDFDVDAESAILMEASTGEILFEKNADVSKAPASVTKIMTLLLVMEALESGKISLDDSVSISENAASMGGSQVFLEEGENMSVKELIKCCVIASANDAAVALAEHTAGSESAFVNEMNKRAKEMGLKNSAFENTTGLDDTTKFHYMSARDIAQISKELIKHPLILEYSSLWQDTIRNGEFTLTNTNRLVRYYDGCNGLKTGSTDKAGFCISACAKRGNMQLIAVIMGADTRDIRNKAARELLDFGFANYGLYSQEEKPLEETKLLGGKCGSVMLYSKSFNTVLPKSELKNVEIEYQIPENLSAPIKAGDVVGKIKFTLNGEKLGECDIFVKEEVPKLKFTDVFALILQKIFTV